MSSQEFGQGVNSSTLPWQGHNWSDSTKEQYFSLLNAEQANELELQRWRLNNEYNTPRAQMERMIEAGINPAAAYQQISSGNSSSPASVSKADTARFHDTTDKLARVNTILGGIRDIMSTVESGVNMVAGIQDVALRHQNNWYDKFRAEAFDGSILGTFSESFFNETGRSKEGFVQVAPGVYASPNSLQMFPEFYQGLKDSWKGGTYDLGVLARQDQHALVERRNRIDGLIQQIFKGLENNASSSEMIRLFMELFAYTSVQNYGGGF